MFAVPMVLSNVFYFSITTVSVMFAGHLGEVELAGSTLANSWATVTGFAFMTQSIVIPLVVFSVVPLGIHFGIVYSLVNKTSLGYK
ncbi:hypothetical protein Gotri_001329, partial [Gossypium trilobum]|nr:hypothetical protein [Gossypium trilobum]